MVDITETLPETAARGIEAIHIIVKQRDELQGQLDRRDTDAALLAEKCNQLKARLDGALAERDHYMRYCTEITARLSNIQTLIATSIEAANHATYKPPEGPTAAKPQPELAEIDAQTLKQLLTRLQPNGGSGPHDDRT